MPRSKYVLEKRKSPDPIIKGSVDPNYYVLLGLTLHLVHTQRIRNKNHIPLLFSINTNRIRLLFGDFMMQQYLKLTRPNSIRAHSI